MVKPAKSQELLSPPLEVTIQPVVADAELSNFAADRAALNLAKLEGDQQLVNQLMWEGYAGPSWTRFATALAEYGVQVIRAWALSGQVFVKCEQKGIGKLPVRERSPDDALELACETVANAIESFRRKVLIPGHWDPSKGASLRTFFIGQCLFRFPNVYRFWLREGRRPPKASDVSVHEVMGAAPASPFVGTRLARTLTQLEPNSPELLEAYSAMGYEQVEIAEILGTTQRAVQSKLFRSRKERTK
ncbi:MAG: sigma factor-like helix-turn-helix DNA-binding protein [Pseudomonadota bacterium]